MQAAFGGCTKTKPENVMHKRRNFDMKAKLEILHLKTDKTKTENEMSRHTSQPDCLNFYPTAPRRWRLGYPTFGTLSFAPLHEAFASAKAKEPNLAYLFFRVGKLINCMERKTPPSMQISTTSKSHLNINKRKEAIQM